MLGNFRVAEVSNEFTCLHISVCHSDIQVIIQYFSLLYPHQLLWSPLALQVWCHLNIMNSLALPDSSTVCLIQTDAACAFGNADDKDANNADSPGEDM